MTYSASVLTMISIGVVCSRTGGFDSAFPSPLTIEMYNMVIPNIQSSGKELKAAPAMKTGQMRR